MEFTSRELATGIIFVAFILLALGLNKNRNQLWRSLLQLARAFAAWKVWTIILTYLTFVAGVVLLAHSLGIWSTTLLKDTLIIAFFVGLPILFNSANFKDGVGMVKHVIKEVLGVAAVLVVYVNLVTFPLWGGELILQISLLFFIMLALVGKNDPKTASAGKFFEVLTGLIAIGLIVYVSIQIAAHFNEFAWEQEAAAFALSVWLPISIIPFIYLFGFIASCEATLMRTKFHNGRRKLPLRVRLAFLLGLRGSLRYASSFTGRWLPELANQKSFRNASRTMGEYRSAVRSNARQNRKRRRRLKKNAGATGVDEHGLWQDRREFHETKEALERLFNSQMALYRHQGGRYWTDPVVVFPAGGFKSLPKEHGIDFLVRDDGQAWIAWRQTIGGFCFGVGGTSDLDTQWRYAGTETPANYPGPDSSEWANILEGSQVSPEWHTDDRPVRSSQTAERHG